MWTYMMAASRGERANTMVSSSRRRNESESPKYGYNLSRPAYRTRRSMRPSLTATTVLGASNSYPYTTAANAECARQSGSVALSANETEMFHTHGIDDYMGAHGGHVGTCDEDGTSLYSPLTPTTILTAGDKETNIFCHKDLVRKHHVGNHVREIATAAAATKLNSAITAGGAATVVRIPSFSHDSDEDEVAFIRGSRSIYSKTKRRNQLRRARSTDDIASDSDSDTNGSCSDDSRNLRNSRRAGRRHHRRSDDEDIDEVVHDRAHRTDDFIENAMENGVRIVQDQSKSSSKPSMFRRALNAIRQRFTKRNRSKPPDWFLERFSNTTNTDKLGKNHHTTTTTTANATSVTSATATAASAAATTKNTALTTATGSTITNGDAMGLASEIHGSSALCNRLSVNPSLPSHYRWLGIITAAVLYNIVFVVGRSVFWKMNERVTPMWYFFDYLCDLIYIVDTLVHMHEGFLDQGLLVRDAYKLRRHYFSTKSWCIDLISMLPTDIAYVWWPPSTCNESFLPCPVIVRLNRLLRLPRMWEWFDRTETAIGYPNVFRICKVVTAILVLIHWNACMYFAISYAIGFSSDNWVYNLNGERNSTLQRQYIYSFYWSTLTLTTIGETPVPENDAEYLFVVADFLAGVLIFATIVGNIGSMISNMNVARVEFQNRMDGVKQYMAFRRVDHELEARVIRWFAYTWSQSGALDEERVLAALPDKLKAEIAIQVHMDTLKQVRIFHDCEPGLLEALVLKLKLQVFSPGDYICRKGDVGKEMYIVKRGKLSVVGDDGVTVLATLGAGSVFGEVSVLEIAGNRTGNRRTANVRSLGYSDLFCLAKRDLWETLADYPEARATLTERGCQLLRKDGLLDEQVFADSQRVHDSIESGIEKLEVSVENLNVRLARLLAEYTASQAKLKQRLAKLENCLQLKHASTAEDEEEKRPRSGRLYSLQPKRRPRKRLLAASKSNDSKQNTL